ncbi:MAG: shikimate dehydrogenase, partial [Bacteroidia bacterium]|nr:shikimate dehydrogenase [Bacteroidia bacterium]
MSVKFGLIGKALSHSFSKEFFEEKFRELNLQGFSYELWEMDNIENIRSFIQEKENIRGFNVTIPFKED